MEEIKKEIMELSKKIKVLEWRLALDSTKKYEKPNGLQWFTLGISLMTILTVLIKYFD